MLKSHDSTAERQGFIRLFIVLSCLICLAGFGSYSILARLIQDKEENQLRSIAHLKTDQIKNWLAERQADAKILALMPGISKALEKGHKASPADRVRIQTILEQVQQHYGYFAVELLDAEGERQFFAGNNINSEQVRRPYILESLRGGGQQLLIDFYRRPDPAYPVGLALIAALQDSAAPDTESAGFILLHMDPERLLFPLIQEWPVPSQSAESQLVRRDQEDVLFLNKLRYSDEPALSNRIPLSRTEIPAVRAILHGASVHEGIDYRGIPVLSASQPVPGTAWFVIAKIDRAEVMGNLYWLTGVTIAVVLLLLAVAGSSLALRYREQQFRQSKAMVEQENLFHEVLDHSADAIFIADADGQLDRKSVV